MDSCKMDESQTLTLENTEAIQLHFRPETTSKNIHIPIRQPSSVNKTINLVPLIYLPDGQLTYKVLPLNSNDQIITTLNGSVNHHPNIITASNAGTDGAETKISVLSALESILIKNLLFFNYFFNSQSKTRFI